MVICDLLGLFGWTLRPQSGGFPSVPENISITVTDGGLKTVSEALYRTGDDGGHLFISSELPDSPPTGSAGQHWMVEIDDIGSGRVCTPHQYVYFEGGDAVELPSYRVTHPMEASTTPGYNPEPTVVQSSGFLYVEGPARLGRSGGLHARRLPASQPMAVSSYPTAFSVTSTLYPDAGDTANSVIQSLTQPTSSTPHSWQWSDRASNLDPVRLSAVNVSGTLHDSYRPCALGNRVRHRRQGPHLALRRELSP